MPQLSRQVVGLVQTAFLATLFLLIPATACASALDHIRRTNTLRCATNVETPEYSTVDDHGPRAAFDADLCRAVAIAILGPSARVILLPYPDDDATRAALRTDAVDLIPTVSITSDPTLSFSQPILLDGVGFLVPVDAQIHSAAELSGRKICFIAETGVESALRKWFSEQRLNFLPFPFQEEGEMEAAFVTGNCTALASDRTRLATVRNGFGPLASRFTLLPDQISSDPLAAATLATHPDLAAAVGETLHQLHTTGRLTQLFNRDLGPQSPLQLPRNLLTAPPATRPRS